MNQENNTAAATDKSRPVHEIRFGSVRAAIWRNTTKSGSMFTVSLSRSYLGKDKEGKEVWKDSSSFGRDDLLVAAKALDEAHSWVLAQR